MERKSKLSVVLATRNEENNIEDCIHSFKSIADDIVVVDEGSTDKTRQLAEKLGARVYNVEHEPIFHVTKQKALDLAKGDWVLQMDADERVSNELASEIKQVINMSYSELQNREKLAASAKASSSQAKLQALFKRHQDLLEARDGKIGKSTGEVAAFFIPRVNFFLGKPLIHAGVYPDGVIRLMKKDKAWFPAKSVHEQITVEGEVGWLSHDLEHHDSPTLSRYLARLNRYTDLKSVDLQNSKTPKNIFYLIYYSSLLPLFVFLKYYLRHKGIVDGPRGFLWSFFSASHFPIAYFKYWGTES